jgi:hypothetical protein
VKQKNQAEKGRHGENCVYLLLLTFFNKPQKNLYILKIIHAAQAADNCQAR